MSAPQSSKQVYLPSSSAPEPKSFLTWLWQDQIINPAHREGNLSIARAVGLFAVGIVVVRSGLGAALVPVF